MFHSALRRMASCRFASGSVLLGLTLTACTSGNNPTSLPATQANGNLPLAWMSGDSVKDISSHPGRFSIQAISSSSPISATLSVDQDKVIHTGTDKLLGMSFDGRSGMNQIIKGVSLPLGYYSKATGTLLPEVGTSWSSQQPKTFRFPGNAYSNYDFRRTIGPLAQRQSLSFNGINGILSFGFDEFVAMAASMGVPASELQMMVTLYPGTTFTDPAALAADWVEYCNAPNNGSNPGGGTDWAAVRAANGHPAPYGIRYWNMGNEPWGTGEFNFDPGPYIAAATPVINRMLAIDPSLRITLPAASGTTRSADTAAKMANWDQSLINTFAGKAYALSPHAFYDDSMMNGSQPRSVAATEQVLDSLIQKVQKSPLKLVLGDHGHAIPVAPGPGIPAIPPDEAVGWRGSLATTDFLLMLSSKPLIERANFWIWGVPAAVYHPIRRNADGSTTLMAVGQLYQQLAQVMLPEALQSNLSTQAIASDTVGYVARAQAFRSTDGKKLNVVVVNRDTLADLSLNLTGLSGWHLQEVRQLQASDLSAATLNIQTLPGDTSNSPLPLPHQSILILEFNQAYSTYQSLSR